MKGNNSIDDGIAGGDRESVQTAATKIRAMLEGK